MSTRVISWKEKKKEWGMKTMQRTMAHSLVVCMLLACAASARATLIITSPPVGDGFAYSDYTVGITMTSADLVTITQLGVQDYGLNGLVDAHDIGLWTNGVLAASATVSAGTVDPLIGDWRFVTLSLPVTIDPGVQFTIAALTSAGDAFHYLNPGSVPIDPSISGVPGGAGGVALGSIYASSILTMPSASYYSSYWVNADFTAAAAVVPEPSSVALLALGGVLVLRRRQRKI